MSLSIEPTLNSLPVLQPRPRNGHKGDFGRVLLIGGSRGMGGAIALSALAAARSGAGLIKIATPESTLPIVAGFEPALMTVPLPEDEAGRITAAKVTLEKLVEWADTLACGPGLGRSAALTDMVAWLYTMVPHPIVFDADALNALAERPDILTQPGGPRILTPHPGEFARLTNVSAQDRDAQRAAASDLAARAGIVIVLKGAHSLITDGTCAVENSTGNPGMATGGTGDVLTGILAGLLGQKLKPRAAAQLGVYVHGRAGDLAAEELGEISLIASDLIRFLPAAFRERVSAGEMS